MTSYVFDHPTEQDTYVLASQLYDTKGYGFLTEENRRKSKQLQIPELNSGFDTVYWYRNCSLTKICADKLGCMAAFSEEAGEAPDNGLLPLTFVADVPKEGNYEVEITLQAEKTLEEALVFLGRRRLAFVGKIEAGTVWKKTFVTNICPIIPRNHAEEMEDTTLDVTIIGKGLHLTAVKVKPWEGKTLYIAGDSTVTDQSADYPYLPGQSYCGWGQMLSYFMGTQMAVSNHSHSGLTTESFRSEGHYKILLDRIQPGDICLFQFAHNDQKLMHLMAEGGYRENLIRYITEIKEKKALPVLVTPLARNTWKGNDGTYNDLLEPYEKACIKLSKEYQIPLLSLHEKSMAMIIKQGRDDAKRYFFPSDYTHSNDYGAYCFAGFLYEELEKYDLAEKYDFAPWQPPQKLPELTIPEHLRDISNPDAENLFENLERPEDEITRVEAFGFVVMAMHFFPTNVYNDMFTDVIGHEVYAGTVECAWQNGLIPKELMEDGKIFPQRPVLGKEFIEVLMNGYQSRRPLPESNGDLILAAEKLGIISEKFSLEGHLTRKAAAEICKKLHI